MCYATTQHIQSSGEMQPHDTMYKCAHVHVCMTDHGRAWTSPCETGVRMTLLGRSVLCTFFIPRLLSRVHTCTCVREGREGWGVDGWRNGGEIEGGMGVKGARRDVGQVRSREKDIVQRLKMTRITMYDM